MLEYIRVIKMNKKGKRLRNFEKNNREFTVRQQKEKKIREVPEVVEIRKPKKKKRITINVRRFAGFMIVCVFIMSIGVSVINLFKLEAEKEDLEKQQANLKEVKEKLMAELEYIDSSEYIEQQARKNLRLIKENEILFVLPEEVFAEEKQETEESTENNGKAEN